MNKKSPLKPWRRDAHPTKMTGRDAHPTKMTGRDAHPTKMTGRDAHPTKMTGRDAHPTEDDGTPSSVGPASCRSSSRLSFGAVFHSPGHGNPGTRFRVLPGRMAPFAKSDHVPDC
ncbi:MAG: hypothetical protein V1792_19355, partial [Pseudomonadota bacterium]